MVQFILCCCLLCPLVLSAQRPSCGHIAERTDSLIQVTDTQIKAALSRHPIADRGTVTIPVVVHVVWHTYEENLSDALILSQIDVLNQCYNAENTDLQYTPDEFRPVIGQVGLHFCLAAVDPWGQPTTGIVRARTDQVEVGFSDALFFTAQGGSDAWDTERYLNIWVANTGEFISGMGTYPNQAPPEKTGVIVHPKYFGINGHPKYGLGKTTVHEVGHYLGLKHLWGDEAGCDTEDDEIADTPPQKDAHTGCPFYPQTGCSESEMFMNFMDYTDDDCMVLFTQGQVERIWATLNVFRNQLISNEVACMAPVTTENEPLLVFPNPGSGLFQCKYPQGPRGMVTYKLFNTLGQCLKQESLLVNDTFQIDLQSQPSGLYFLNIEGEVFDLLKL